MTAEASLRLAMSVVELRFKSLPAALRDPVQVLAADFDPKIDKDARLPVMAPLELEDKQMRIFLSVQNALVRVDNPANDEDAVARLITALEKIQSRIDVVEYGRIGFRSILLADRPGRQLPQLVNELRGVMPQAGAFLNDAVNLGLVAVLPYPKGRRRIHFSPGEASHMEETHQLKVAEQVFYFADVDHILGVNVTFASTIRANELRTSLRTSRDYAFEILSKLPSSNEEAGS